MFFEMDLHILAEVTFVITDTAGVFLDLLVNILSVDMQGVTTVGAEVTFTTLKFFRAASFP